MRDEVLRAQNDIREGVGEGEKGVDGESDRGNRFVQQHVGWGGTLRVVSEGRGEKAGFEDKDRGAID